MADLKTIFFVDDEPDILDIVSTMFQDICEVVTTTDPKKAVEIIQSGKIPDVFLTDLSMPGFNGIQLLELLRSKGLTTPVIIITGHSGSHETLQAIRLGAFDLIEKPFSPQRLFRTVQLALSQCALNDLNREILQKYASALDLAHVLLQKYQASNRDRVMTDLKTQLDELLKKQAALETLMNSRFRHNDKS